jgi:eukaryotic-like serine/threonine-protein kinase
LADHPANYHTMTTSQSRFIAALVAASSLVSVVPAGAEDMFRGDVSHNAVFAEKAPASFDKPVWAFQTNAPVISSAAIEDGTAYFGSDDRNLYAVDTATGAKKWSFATEGKIRSTPAVSGGLVYFISFDGKIYALDAKSGAKKWVYETAGERQYEAKGIHGCTPKTQTMPDFWDTYESSPAVVNGVVYVGCGDGFMYALDASTGALRWKFATGDVVHVSPAVVDGVVYFGSWDTFFYALDAATGAVKWRFKTGDDPQYHNQTGIQSSPVVKDGVVYFGCRDSHFYALDAKTGAKKWAYDNHGTWINASAAVKDGLVSFVTSEPSFFITLDAATGAEKIKSASPYIMFSSPVVVGNTAYAGSFDGALYSCDIKSGNVKKVYATQASRNHWGAYVKADGKVDESLIWPNGDFEQSYYGAVKFFESGAILSTPVIHQDALYVGSADGCMYCFR